jgi:hypothetical protein
MVQGSDNTWSQINEVICRPQCCYGWLAVVSDVSNGGFALNVNGGNVQDLDYIGVCITEQSVDVAKTNTKRMNKECNEAPVNV